MGIREMGANEGELREALAALRKLPSVSPIVVELVRACGGATTTVASLVGKIEKDVGLSSRILRVANSSFYGYPSAIGSIKDAVVLVGVNNIRSLALAAGLIETFPDEGRIARDCWRHSIQVACSARALARALGRDEEEAFTAGLMHDMGKLALYLLFPEKFMTMLALVESGMAEEEAEHQVFGFEHGRVGFEMARQWKFPPVIQEAILHHHHPTESGNSLADLIYLASTLCHAREKQNVGDDDIFALVDASVWQRSGLKQEQLAACFAEMDEMNDSLELVL